MPKVLSGIVSSNKADKTIVVKIATRKTHPIYKKQYTRTVKLMAHDPNNEAKVGDKVLIVETRPISARKRFKLDQIVDKGSIHFEETDATSDISVEEQPDQKVEAQIASEEKVEKSAKKADKKEVENK